MKKIKTLPGTSANVTLDRLSSMLNEHIDEFPWKLDGAVAHVTAEPLKGSPDTPAWYIPSKGDVYINLEAIYYGDDKVPLRQAVGNIDRDRIPAVVMGMLAHETAHSRWSTWMDDVKMKPAVLQVATLFEELRIEKRASDWRGGRRDRTVPSTWLRGCFTWLLKKMTEGDLSTQPLALGHTWALIVGRYVAGIALLEEVQPIDMAVRTALSDDTVDIMREILDEAVQTDDVKHRLPELAQEWLDLLSSDDEEQAPWSLFLHSGEAQEGGEEEGGELGEVIAAAVEQVAEAVDETGAALPDEEPLSNPAELAPKVFGGHGKGRGSFTRHWRTREPSAALRAEAARLTRTLETLALPSVTLTHVPSEIPPGRLRGREAVRQSAERSMAMMTTATPWERTKRRRSHTRPVIVGIMTDVSGSMSWAQSFVADFAWVMAKAGVRVGARTAAVTFGDLAEMVTRPGEVPQLVRERDSDGGCEEFDKAAAAIEGVLHLGVPTNAAKVLFIVSDGHLVNPGEMGKAARWLERWTKGGTLVVWIGTDQWGVLSEKVRPPGKAVVVPIGYADRSDTGRIMRSMEKVVVSAARGMVRAS